MSAKTRFPLFPPASSAPAGPAAEAAAPRLAPLRLSLREGALFGLLLAAFLLAAGWRLGLPGLNYDEAYPSSVALRLTHPAAPLDLPFGFRPGAHFLFVQPDPLHGPVRAYLMAAWFSAFPWSTAALRLCGVLLGALALWLSFRLAARWFGVPAGLAAAALLAFDPVFVFLARNDIHFNGLDACLRVGCVLLVSRLWTGASLRREGVCLAGLVLLGLWTTMEFAWFAMGVLGAVAVVGRQRWRQRLAGKSWLGWLALPLLLWLALFWYVQRLTPEPILPDALRRIGEVVLNLRWEEATKRLRLIGGTFNGNWLETFYLGAPVNGLWHPFWEIFAPAAALFLLGSTRPWAADPEGRQARLFFLLCAGFFSLSFVALTPQAYAAHHVWVAYPFFHLFAAGVYARLYGQAGRGLRVALAAAGALYLAGGARMTAAFHARFADGRVHTAWSSGVNDLARELEARGRPAVVLDWGFGHNLAVLTRGRVPLFEPHIERREGFRVPEYRVVWDRFFGDRRNLYVLHPAERSFMPAGRSTFFDIAAEYGVKPALVKTVADAAGPYAEIYEAVPAR